MIGYRLGDRYEIIARIGGGGMAIVYKAHDELLDRYVAVKVLRQQYAHDEEFVRRFRREAQSAASLSHPNVVSIYDVGQSEDDVHYIVMEYVEGKNLNEIIKERAPLMAEEAVRIASQICDALDHAHSKGIIHRDIKPHNILIGLNGRVKVTDFGIARAATSVDLTQTGAVMGSVHYFSPEHAKGVSQGARSDLYSLGIVLYQMLTNRLPFLGDSPISVALKHLQEPVEEPRKVNPMIPQSVENIILKALRKQPEERYHSAREMLEDLERALTPERINAPKVQFPDPEDEDDHPTRVMPAIRGAGRPGNGRPGNGRPGNGRADKPAPSSDPPADDRWEQVRDKPMPWLKPTIWAAVVILLLAGAWFGIQQLRSMLVVPEVVVPDVIGLPYETALAALEDAGLVAELLRQENNREFAENTVISQNREPGMKVRKEATVGLVVSLGPLKERMPDLVNTPLDEALKSLRRLGVPEEHIEQEWIKGDAPNGTVLQQSIKPEAEFLVEEDRIVLSISEGPGVVEMPDLIGLTESEAQIALLKANLEGEFRYEPDYSAPEGKVYYQHPYQPGEEVEPGSKVTVYVSTGLPADALQPLKMIELVPAEEGTVSTFSIRISDAAGENREWGTRDTAKTVQLPVQVTVSPDKGAIITVYRDNVWYNVWTVTYRDAMLLEMGVDGLPSSSGPGGIPSGQGEAPDQSGGDNGAENSGNDGGAD